MSNTCYNVGLDDHVGHGALLDGHETVLAVERRDMEERHEPFSQAYREEYKAAFGSYPKRADGCVVADCYEPALDRRIICDGHADQLDIERAAQGLAAVPIPRKERRYNEYGSFI